jgi:hypothetical protein
MGEARAPFHPFARKVFKFEREIRDGTVFKMKNTAEEDPKCVDTDRLKLRESLRGAIPMASESS